MVCGDSGYLRIWEIEGICTREIPNGGDNSLEMKQDIGADVVVSHHNQLRVWGTAANNWETTLNNLLYLMGIQFNSSHRI